MRRLLATLGTVAAIAALTTSALASSGLPSTTTFNVRHGRVVRRCTRQVVPKTAAVTVWVSVNGQDLHSGSPDSSLTQYYAGNGTLVMVRVQHRAAPLCAQTTTWLRSARIEIKMLVS